VGRTFSIEATGIHITTLNVTESETVVHIEFDNGSTNSAPTISAVEAVAVGDGFQFSVEAADVDADDLAIFWNFEAEYGDLYAPERIGSGSSTEHTFADEKGRRVSVRVSDMRGAETVGWVDLHGYVNQAPRIQEISPTSVTLRQFEFEIDIDDQELLTYAWDFGDGNSSTLPAPLYQYALEGNYTVTLVVSDGEFNATLTVHADTVETQNVPPLADAGPDITTAAGQEVILDGSGSSDPDDYPLSFTRFIWSSSDHISITNASKEIASLVAPNEAGTYIIRLQVNDGAASSNDTMTLTVTVT
jgi:hypothetical protein